MGCKCSRKDAAGNAVLPHAGMLIYYKSDPISLDIIRRNMPFRYVCLPDIELRIICGVTNTVEVYRIYPGETKHSIIEINEKQLIALRAFYRRKPWGKPVVDRLGKVVFRKKGGVIMDPLRRYGLWS